MTNTNTELLGVGSKLTPTHKNATKAKGENIMKNTIKMNRTNELKAKEEARLAAEKEAALKEVKPLNIVETLKQLEDAKTDAKVVCDKDGNPIAVCGGKYLCEMYKGEVIGATTQEKLDAIKARIDKGIHGDGLLHKMVTINGKNIPCVGATIEEIEKDIHSLEVYSKEHPTEPRRDLTVATMLKDAGFKSENLEQVTVAGADYLIVYVDPDNIKNYVMDLNGATVKDKDGKEVNLSDIEDELSRKTIKILLLERLNKAVNSKKVTPVVKPVTPSTPKTTRTRKSTKVEVTVEIRPCSILLSRDLRGMTLEEIIRGVLCGQRWSTRAYGSNPNCPWLELARDTISNGSTMLREVVNPTTAFVLERIADNSPIEANNPDELTHKIARVVYEALRDEPYFGMDPSTGSALSRIIAERIVENSNICYR